jgi:hypothetical protein
MSSGIMIKKTTPFNADVVQQVDMMITFFIWSGKQLTWAKRAITHNHHVV